MEKLIGTVVRITYENPQNGWMIVKVKPSGPWQAEICVMINAVHVFCGATFEFKGEWITHPKFGREFKAHEAIELPPCDIEAMEKYLGSGLIYGLGPKTAKKIVKYFGADTLNVFEHQIERLLDVDGISKKKLLKYQQEWQEHRQSRDLIIFLAKYDVSTLISIKIYKHYGKNSLEIVQKNPYKLAQDIIGIGFLKADVIALKMGIKTDSSERITAAIMHVMLVGRDNGHTYLSFEQIIQDSIALLYPSQSIIVDDLNSKINLNLELLVKNKELICDINCYFLPQLYDAEKLIAEKIKVFAVKKIDIDEDRAGIWLDKYESLKNIKLSSDQRLGVLNCAKNFVSVLTGGPGSGKTTTLKTLTALFIAMKKQVMLAAPTGRAAQRMTDVIGIPARTIHRMLEINPKTFQFLKNQENPLECDVLIIDECSMLDISLASAILKAIDKNTQIVFVGDVDQLPSVGPGSFLNDLILSKSVAVIRLKKIFRQASESLIIDTAYKINNGEFPNLCSPIEKSDIWEKGIDCLFIESDEVELSEIDKNKVPIYSTLKYSLNASQSISRLILETIPKHFPKFKDIQVLSPMQKGSLGVVRLNYLLQQSINPRSDCKKELVLTERVFRVGDKIIVKKNNYELMVFNGDIGKVIDIDVKEKKLDALFEGEEKKIISFKSTDLADIDLAYAITIHKSQGSEFEAVIIPITTQHYPMLYRNLLYTAVTRAKKLCILIGTKKAFYMACQNIDNRIRQSKLLDLLK